MEWNGMEDAVKSCKNLFFCFEFYSNLEFRTTVPWFMLVIAVFLPNQYSHTLNYCATLI